MKAGPLELSPAAVGVLAVGAIGVLWFLRSNAAAIGTAAVGAVVDAGTGAVFGIGDAVGVPRTSQSQCDADLAAGNTWDASFSCPASRWLSEGVFGSTPAPAPTSWGREVRTPVFTGGASGSW